MSRKGIKRKRKLLPDVMYDNLIVTKLVNTIMKRGRRSIAEKIAVNAIEKLAASSNIDAMEALGKVIENTKPNVEVRSKRIGGATYQVPVEIQADRALALALRALVISAKTRKSERTMEDKFAAELVDAYNGKGGATKMRTDKHKMAEANKVFACYA
ncbi:MAG: 30S ribosomal protein S7 [Proteobacteria bacterium]|nr:30S ribosomal protein S7 [Pseudomonadota bacterium]